MQLGNVDVTGVVARVPRSIAKRRAQRQQTFGSRVRECRIGLRLTQERLAKMVRRTKATVSHWERLRTVPDSDTVLALSMVLQCDATWLQWGSPSTLPPATTVALDVVDRGGVVQSIDPRNARRVRAPNLATGTAVRAMLIDGDVMAPIYRRGDTVYVSIEPVHIDLLLGMPSVVELPNGMHVLRVVEVSSMPGRVTLRAPGGHEIADVPVTVGHPVLATTTAADRMVAELTRTRRNA